MGRERVLRKIEAAHKMVSDLCHRRREWIMSIPAREDYDPDIVIGSALREASSRLELLEKALKTEIKLSRIRNNIAIHLRHCETCWGRGTCVRDEEYQDELIKAVQDVDESYSTLEGADDG